jgi:hypothetical protein
MRFMILIKATERSESGVMPDPEEMTKMFTEMGKFNEELVDAGVMVTGDGLLPSSKGARVHFAGEKRTVTDGPFPETKELVAGYWIWELDSMDEAIEWVKRCPNPMMEESVVEIRQIATMEDFGDAMTPELQEQEQRLRARSENA